MTKSRFLLLVTVTASATAAHAQDTRGYFGGLIGLVLPTSTGSSARLTFGANAGYHLESWLTVGGYFLTSSSSSSSGAVTINNRTTFFGGQAHYNFEPIGMHIGVLAGGVRVSSESTGIPGGPGSVGNTEFAIGPKFGYDYKLDGSVTLGAEANVFFIGGDKPGTTASNDPIVNVLGAIKYWF